MKKGDYIEILAEKPIYGGKCIGTYGDIKVIIEKAVPGEVVNARVWKIKKSYLEVTAESAVKPSVHRKKAECKYFGVCGGCKLLDIEYPFQAKIKEDVVKDTIERLGKVKDFEYYPIIPSNVSTGYRNKMEFTFSNKRYFASKDDATEEDIFSLGFHAPKFYKKTLDIDYCYLQSEKLNKIFIYLKEKFETSGLPAYDIQNHVGFYRHLVLRETVDGKVMVNIITKEGGSKELVKIAEETVVNFPEVVSFVNTINSGTASIAFGERCDLLAGNERMTDKIADLVFEVSSNSFFQVNPKQTTKLYDTALDFAELKQTDKVLDLYCGVGTISLYIAKAVSKVVGYELVENAVSDARKNAKANGISNCEFYSGDLMKLAGDGLFKKHKFDVIITDPPRNGMHPKVVRGIISSGVRKVIYVSCNPSTFARDVEIMCTEGGYKLTKVKAVDMFPNTYHVETVGLLVKD